MGVKVLMGSVMVTIAALLFACAPESGQAGSTFEVRDSSGVVIVMNGNSASAPLCTVRGPTLTIGDTSGRPEYELYRVFGARRLRDGRIALVNQGSQELRFYDRTGRYLRSAGGAGQGPGEFQSAFYLWVTAGDTVWVGDSRPWKYNVFSPDGDWIRTVRPARSDPNSPALMTVLADGRSVIASRPTGGPLDFRTRREVVAVVHSPNGNPTDTLRTFDYGVWGRIGDDPQGMFIYPMFESAPQMDGQGEVILAGHGSEPEVAVYAGTPQLSLRRLIRWDAGDRTIRSSDIVAERRRLEARYPDLDPAERRVFVAPLVSEERPVAERFPAFNELVANRDGGFWVREYPRPESPPGRRWLVFDAEGRMTCRVELPEVQVVDLGEGYVLVERESSLGVEQIAMYEVLRPTN